MLRYIALCLPATVYGELRHTRAGVLQCLLARAEQHQAVISGQSSPNAMTANVPTLRHFFYVTLRTVTVARNPSNQRCNARQLAGRYGIGRW